jgi:excisionase family DNA binding protein
MGEVDRLIYITTHQAAKFLGVSVRTIQNWVNTNQLNATHTAGGHRRILLSDAQELLERKENEFVTPPSANRNQADRALKVLVVEDDTTLLKLYELKLRSFVVQCELVTASDGQQGLLMLGLCKPDILMLDLMMPGMNGFDLLRTLQRMPDFKHIKVIVVSALTAADILNQGGLPSGVAIVPKPVSFDVIETMFAQRAVELGLSLGPLK